MKLQVQRIWKVLKTKPLLGILTIYLLLTVIFTWPILPNFDNKVTDQGDPLFVAWVIDAGTDWMKSGFTENLWDQEIFYPYPNTLAFSDHSLTLALQFLPLSFVTSNPVVIVNYTQLLAFFLSAVFAFLLVKYYTKENYSAFAAGFVYAFAAYHIGQISHLQIASYQYIPLVVLGFEMLIKKPGWKPAMLFAVSFLANAFVSIHHLAFVMLPLIVIMVARYKLIISHLQNKKKILMAIKHWGLSGIAILVPLVVFYIPYLGVSGLHNITRSAADAEFYSAHYYDYFVAPETHWLLGDFSVNLFEDKGGKARVEHTLFFGVITLVVAGFGAVTFKKSKDNRTKVIYALVFLLSIGLAFGPVLNLNGVEIQMPYKFLQENIILLQAIRVPTRISVISLLAISVLVGFWMQKRSRLSVLWLVIILIGLEQISWPLKLSQPAIANQDLYNIIEQQIPENSALLNFPVGKSNLQYMRQNIQRTADRQVPSINGYSGIFPSGYRDILNLLSTKEFFQSPRTGLGVLADLGVDYFVYHNEFCIAEFDQLRCETLHAQLHALVDAKVIQLVGEAGKDFVYDISVLKSDTSIQTITDISATTIPESNVIKITHKNSTEQLWVQSHFDDYPHSELLTYQLQIKYMNKGVVVRTQDHKIYQPLFLLPNQEKTTEFHYKPPVWVGYESIELNISMKNN